MNKRNPILLTSLSALAVCLLASSSADAARPARAPAERGRAARIPDNAQPIRVASRARPAARPALRAAALRRGPPQRARVRPEPFVSRGALAQIRDIARDWNHAVAARDHRRLVRVDQRLGQWLRGAIDQADRAERTARGRRDRSDAHDHAVAVRRLARDVHEAGARRPFRARNVQSKRTALYQLIQLTERGERR